MKIITADYEKIAIGIYSMLQDLARRGDESYLTALSYGMLPAPFMQMAEKMVIEKLAKPFIENGMDEEIAMAAIKVDYMDAIGEFNHSLASAILHVAQENSLLLV